MDYEDILRAAEAEADVILWDGGNNDLPFYRPDLAIVVADPLRPGHELRYHPGEANLRIADVVVINKVDSATPEALAQVRAEHRRGRTRRAAIVEARSSLALEGGEIRGRTVVVVEDGPTLTHGGMTYGAGVVAAKRFGAAEIVDPRPYATGELAATLAKYPKLERLLPAMGYGDKQIHELEAALEAVPADVVLAATPIDLTRVLTVSKPVVRVRYELEPVSGSVVDALAPVIARAKGALAAGADRCIARRPRAEPRRSRPARRCGRGGRVARHRGGAGGPFGTNGRRCARSGRRSGAERRPPCTERHATSPATQTAPTGVNAVVWIEPGRALLVRGAAGEEPTSIETANPRDRRL